MTSNGQPITCINPEEAAKAHTLAVELAKRESMQDFGFEFRVSLARLAALLLDWRWDGERYSERYYLPAGQVVRSVEATIQAWSRVTMHFEAAKGKKPFKKVLVY